MAGVIRVVGAVIFDPKSDSYFVGQRGKNKKFPLKWEFIGGKIEEGEDLLQATEREFAEEVNQKIEAQKLLHTIQYDYGGEVGTVEINFIKCQNFSGQPEFNTEVYEDCRWVPRSEMPNLDWIEADREFALNLASGRAWD